MAEETHESLGEFVRIRRKRAGFSQGLVAERVRKISGKKFSQQSLGKLEKDPNAQSKFGVEIIQALDELDHEVNGTPPPPPPKFRVGSSVNMSYDIKEASEAEMVFDQFSEEQALEFTKALLTKLGPKSRAQLLSMLADSFSETE